jgi:HlyD family secretion protein
MSKRLTALACIMGLFIAAGNFRATAESARAAPVPRNATTGSSVDKQWQAVAPGRVEPQSGSIKIAAGVMGLIDKVFVRANDTVFSGEPLIRLSDDELRARLAGAEAQVAVRKHARDDQPATQVALNRHKAEDAVADAERTIFDARTAVDRTVAEWRTKRQTDGGVTAARSALARAQDALEKRQEELRKLKPDRPLPTALEGELRIARAELTVARLALDKMTLRSPIDGTVLQIGVKEGEMAAPASPLLLLANISALRVRAELDERDIKSISLGQAATVRAAAFPAHDFEGKVSSIAHLVEPAKLDARGLRDQTDVEVVEVMIELAQPGPLTVGMKADVYFGLNKSSTSGQ